jgi:hypothetical protein
VGDTGKAKDMVAAWKELSDVPPEQSLGFAHILAGAGLTQEAIEILEKVKSSDKFPFSVPFTLAGYYLVEKNLPKLLRATSWLSISTKTALTVAGILP